MIFLTKQLLRFPLSNINVCAYHVESSLRSLLAPINPIIPIALASSSASRIRLAPSRYGFYQCRDKLCPILPANAPPVFYNSNSFVN